MLMAAGCGGGGNGGPPVGGPPGVPDPEPPGDRPPAAPNPVGLTFRPTDLGTPNASDGRNYRTPEYMGHWGLDSISADIAYQRGYFGQDVTIAVADDGLDPTHPDLAGRIRAPRHVRNRNANVFERSYGGRPGEGHGTFVALVAAGARGNSGGSFQIDIAGGSPIPTNNVHGVAPSASVMPIQLSGGGRPEEAMEHAVANGAQVLNFSIGVATHYYGKYTGRDGVWLTVGKPLFRPLIERDLAAFDRRGFADAARTLENQDIVAVWGGGNEGWNSFNEVHMCGKNYIGEDGCLLGDLAFTPQDFMKNFSWLSEGEDGDRDGPTVSFKDMWGTDCGSDDCADYNSGGGWKVAPLFQPGLLGKWLVVGALNRDGRIAEFSNGCGETRNWCLFAPGEDLSAGPDRRGNLTGTSFAAPMVSGALAVLKSRLPSMPMEVVQAVLLVSADPLGTRVNNPDEPDPVYGWGRLNLGNAILQQGRVRLPYSVSGTTSQAAPLSDARVTLSPALAHVGARMQAVEVAVGGVGNAYYNMKLSGIVNVETESPLALGSAAWDMLSPASGYRVEDHGLYAQIGREASHVQAVGVNFSANVLGRWRLQHNLCNGCENSAWREWSVLQPAGPVVAAPFFGRAGGGLLLQMQGNGVRPFAAISGRASRHAPWRQFGLQWRHAHGGLDIVAEFSRIDESRSLWGANFGALGNTRTETRRSQLLLSGPLGGNWRGFAGYEHHSGEVFVTGGMLSGISGLRAEGWSAGTQGRHLFRDDDTLRFSVRQETRVRAGQVRLNHLVATGSSFVDAFYRGHSQALTQQQTVIDLRTQPTMRYSLAYALPLREAAALAFGLEYEDASRNAGLSAQWRMNF